MLFVVDVHVVRCVDVFIALGLGLLGDLTIAGSWRRHCFGGECW